MSKFDFDVMYYAERAREERVRAERAATGQVRDIHRTMSNAYVIRAMQAVVSDGRHRS